MRRFLILLVPALLAPLVIALPADAGGSSAVTIVKEVEGDLPDNAEFVIEFRCRSIASDPSSEFVEQEVVFTGPDSTEFLSGSFSYCIVEEVETSGADNVAYQCEASDGAECTTDQIVDLSNDDEGTETVVLTVTNEFAGEPTTTPTSTTAPDADTTTPAAAAPAQVQRATPAFTG